MTRRKPPPRPDEPAVVELVRQLGGLLGELNLGEVEVAIGETRIRLTRSPSGAGPIGTPGGHSAALSLATAGAAAPSGAVIVEAPMVGTFYRASSPTADPYVQPGDVVKEGQTLCIIEAMKLMNEIEARAAGRVAKILVENGQPVEYGQPLFHIDPAG
jgi:acetyl-CoA carboxylase biotin carboxyl carrier protein